MIEFACTGPSVLGRPALAAEAPGRKTQQAKEKSAIPVRSCAPWVSL